MGLFDRFRTMFAKGSSKGSAAGGKSPSAGGKAADSGKAKKFKKLDVGARFEFSKEASTGTMSKFQRVRDIANGQTVGLKILDPEKYETFESRWRPVGKPWEGQIAMKFHHPRIVETLEAGDTIKGERYLLMEYLDGPNLSTLVNNDDPLLDGNRVELMRQMTEAVAAVHNAGFIHRDVCPRNFICSPDGKSLKLIDFGLTLPDLPPYKQPGNRTGTPLYMAPEIVRRRATDKRVDIFALGVSFYRLFSGAYPWGGQDATGTGALAHDTDPAQPILELAPDLRPELAALIMKCIEPDPEKRPATCEAILNAIRPLKGDGKRE
jgi:serine/threonine-protein kinase